MKDIENDQYIITKLNSLSESLLLCLGSLYSTDVKTKNLAKKRINELIIHAEDLCTRLGIHYMGFNAFCNTLMLIQNLDVPNATLFLRKHAYEERLYSYFGSTLKKYKNNEDLSDLDYKLSSLFIETDSLHENDALGIYERLIKDCLQKNNHISMETFVNLMKQYTRLLAKRYIDDPIVVVTPNRVLKGKKAYTTLNQIELNEEELKSMYATSNFEMLKAIYHEIEHLHQTERIKNKEFDDDLVVRMYKDDVLSTYLQDYYEENYERTSLELDAEIVALEELLRFFNRNGIEFRGTPEVEKDIDRLSDALYDPKRKRGPISIDIDELFAHVVKFNSDLLSNYDNFIRRRKEQQ